MGWWVGWQIFASNHQKLWIEVKRLPMSFRTGAFFFSKILSECTSSFQNLSFFYRGFCTWADYGGQQESAEIICLSMLRGTKGNVKEGCSYFL